MKKSYLVLLILLAGCGKHRAEAHEKLVPVVIPSPQASPVVITSSTVPATVDQCAYGGYVIQVFANGVLNSSSIVCNENPCSK